MGQGTKSVDEYLKEMKLNMIQTNVEEDEEANIARFINGFNHDITHIMELYHYMTLEKMVHMAILDNLFKYNKVNYLYCNVRYLDLYFLSGFHISFLFIVGNAFSLLYTMIIGLFN